jgi:hypothetical protein
VTTLNVQNTGSSAPHNGAVVSVSEVCFDGNVDVSFDLFQTYDNNFASINAQLGEKLTGAPGASVIDESNMVGMVVSDKNHYSHMILLVLLVLMYLKLSNPMFRRLMEQPMVCRGR